MATPASLAPKRNPIVPSMTVTFTGENAREEARKALSDDTKPVSVTGLDWEQGVCSQEIEVDGKPTTFLRVFWKPVVSGTEAVLSLIESDPIGVIKDLTYGMAVAFNQVVRESIINENSGPIEAAKAFEKQVAAFMKQRAALGKPISEEKARTMIAALMENE